MRTESRTLIRRYGGIPFISKAGVLCRSLIVLSCILFSSMVSYAQNTISGTVTDEKGEPLIGVTVTVKDGKETNSVATNVDGKYRIKGSPKSEITFSYVGYSNVKENIGNRSTLNVGMSVNNQLLQDLVVVGYGTQKKVNLTGAVAQVNSEVLKDKSSSSVTQMLQGVMPNVNVQVNTGTPGAGGTITIRGTGSVNSSSPLIIVDGVPGSIDQLNSNDIESISVLKDASSAAIYGARAAFGVILITTKTAKPGKTNVSFEGYLSWSKPTVSTDFITSGYEHALIYDTSYKSLGTSATGYTEEDYAQLEARRYDKTENPDRPWVVVTKENGKDKYNYYGNFDWWNWMYKKNMLSQSYNVNVSGGSDKVQYYLSASYYTKEGMLKQADENYRQYTFTSKINAELYPGVKISNNTTYFDSSHEYPGENAANAAFARTMINCAPYYVPIGPDGNYTGVMKNGKLLCEGRIADICGGVSKGSVGYRRFKNTFSLEAKPISNLKLNADYTFSFTMDDNWKRQGEVYVSTGYANETQQSTTTQHKTDYYQKSMSFNPSHVINAYATYDNKFGEAHNVTAMVGLNYEKQSYHNLLGYRTDEMSESLNDLNLATGTDIQATGGASAYSLFGLFYRLNYNYDDRYLFEVNGRYDGSSRFQKGHRYGFFPSFSAAWRANQETFLKGVKWITNLKPRASYGILGNQLGVDTYPYSVMNQALSSSCIVDGQLVYYLTTPKPVSGDYTWEKVHTWNFGLDLGFLKNRLSFTGDYFIRNTTDMFVNGVTLPDVYGTSSPRQNAGELKTNGYEITLNWNDAFNLLSHKFTYGVYASLGDATSKITKYQGNDSKILTDYYEGMTLGEIWGYRTGGLFQSDAEATEWTSKVDQTNVNRDIWTASGAWSVARAGDVKFLDLDGDNKITSGANTADNHGDLEKIGNSTPRYNFGFGLNFAWYGLDFSIAFQGIGRCDLYPNKEMEKFWGSWGRVNSAFLPVGIADLAWSETNTDGYFPQLERGSAAYKDNGQLTVVNDRYLQNLAYIRLKNLSIGYTLPNNITRKVKIEKLRVYLAGDNLCYWTKFKTDYIDPEQAMSSSDARIYPFSKTFTVGLNVNF